MSLNYDVREIPYEIRVTEYEENGEKFCRMSDLTHSMIWGCLTTRIGEITIHNWREWFARYETWSRLTKAEGIQITASDVYRHIGLKTNVFPEISRTKWMREYLTPHIDSLLREAQDEIDRAIASFGKV